MKTDDQNKIYHRLLTTVDLYTSKKIMSGHPENISEHLIITKYLDLLKNSNVLDIGIGGGRTTKFLYPISKSYIGIDYSPEMVEASKLNFPHLPNDTLLEWDARNIKGLNKNFDFIFYTWNGLDCMGHDDRIVCLQSIYDILNPGGLFYFSTHLLKSNMPNGWGRRLINRQLPLTYFIDPQTQIKQLQEIGFEIIDMLDQQGNDLDLLNIDSTNYMMNYLVRKSL